MSDPVPQVMNELLDRMAAILVNQQRSPFAQDSGNRTAGASQQLSDSSSVRLQREIEDRVLESLSTLLDNRFRSLENGMLEPLREVVDQLGERCGRIETMLQGRSETVTIDLHRNGNISSCKTSISPLITSIQQPAGNAASRNAGGGEKLIGREKQQATELHNRITRIAPTVYDLSASCPSQDLKSDTGPDQTARERHHPTCRGSVCSWTSSASACSDSEGGDFDINYTVGAKYDPDDLGKKNRKKGNPLALKKVDIDKEPEAVRALKPRPCHFFYLAKSGCTRPDCEHGHHYRLSKDHIKYLKQMVMRVPCPRALKKGVPCPKEHDCIYPHKCPTGWNCRFGTKCRFVEIQGGHPYPGDFHTKQNYYDEKKPEDDVLQRGWKSKEKTKKDRQKGKARKDPQSRHIVMNEWKPADQSVDGWAHGAPDPEGTLGDWSSEAPAGWR